MAQSSWQLFGFAAILGLLASGPLVWAARSCSRTRWVHVLVLALVGIGAIGEASKTARRLAEFGLTVSDVRFEVGLVLAAQVLATSLVLPMWVYWITGTCRIAAFTEGGMARVLPVAGGLALFSVLPMWSSISGESLTSLGFFLSLEFAVLLIVYAFVVYGLSRLFRLYVRWAGGEPSHTPRAEGQIGTEGPEGSQGPKVDQENFSP